MGQFPNETDLIINGMAVKKVTLSECMFEYYILGYDKRIRIWNNCGSPRYGWSCVDGMVERFIGYADDLDDINKLAVEMVTKV